MIVGKRRVGTSLNVDSVNMKVILNIELLFIQEGTLVRNHLFVILKVVIISQHRKGI